MTPPRRPKDDGQREMTLSQKLWRVNWGLLLLICIIAAIGFAMLYSAAGGNFSLWAGRQMLRFAVGLLALIVIALLSIRFWLRFAYIFYALSFALLVLVEISGLVGMGARRWIDLKLFQLQPSELMKVALVLALARYFHSRSVEDIRNLNHLIIPALMIAMPAALILRQPDLGTAIMFIGAGLTIFFLAGVRLWLFGAGIAATLAALPLAWNFLHDYQKQRVLTFLNPESDPLGAGYHIMQSKIAMGSGGLFGKGFARGSQGHLNFLPEKQTDFIFAMLAEEFGFVGSMLLMTLYGLLIAYGLAIAVQSRSQFGRLLAAGVSTTLALYVFVNIAMVTGLIPVVGVPLPMVSYGGTAMLTVLIGFGLLMNVHIHREIRVPRHWSGLGG